MSRQTRVAGTVAVAAMLVTALFSAETSGASAQESNLGLIEEITATSGSLITESTGSGAPVAFTANPVVQPVDADDDAAQADEGGSFNSLAELVAATDVSEPLSDEMHCLAGAIYFETRGEPLEGQLAVGRVIVNRANSPRFPSSYCGVVFQRSQFSFVRGGRMPAIKTGSLAWQRAKAIAKISVDGSWESPAKGALFFHANYVSPNWRLQRVAQVENHIFYR